MDSTTNLSKVICSRRNIKLFKPDSIPLDEIKQLLSFASYAPNHRMTEPWKILWIGFQTRSLLNHKTNFGGAPIVLAILSEKGKTEVDRDENYAAVACFIQNFMLAAWEKGIGTGWSSLGVAKNAQETMKIEPEYEVVGLIPVGYPAEIPEVKNRTPISEKMKELP